MVTNARPFHDLESSFVARWFATVDSLLIGRRKLRSDLIPD